MAYALNAQVPDPVTTIKGKTVETKTYIDSDTYVIEGKIYDTVEEAEDFVAEQNVYNYVRLKRQKDRAEAQLTSVSSANPEKSMRIKAGSNKDVLLITKGDKTEEVKLTGNNRGNQTNIKRALERLGAKTVTVLGKTRANSILFTVSANSGLETIDYEIK